MTTYIAVRPMDQKLEAHINKLNLKYHPIKERRLHVTLLHSTYQIQDYKSEPTTHIAHPTCYKILTTQTNKACLVLLLDAPTLLERHVMLRIQYNLTHTHQEYIPHVTISYDIPQDLDLEKLPVYTENIILGEEYIERRGKRFSSIPR